MGTRKRPATRNLIRYYSSTPFPDCQYYILNKIHISVYSFASFGAFQPLACKRVNRYRALPPLLLPPFLRGAAPGGMPPRSPRALPLPTAYPLLPGLCPRPRASPSLTRALPLPTAHPVSTGASPLCRRLTQLKKRISHSRL